MDERACGAAIKFAMEHAHAHDVVDEATGFVTGVTYTYDLPADLTAEQGEWFRTFYLSEFTSIVEEHRRIANEVQQAGMSQQIGVSRAADATADEADLLRLVAAYPAMPAQPALRVRAAELEAAPRVQ